MHTQEHKKDETRLQRSSRVLREKTEAVFRWLTLRVVNHPWWTIAIMLGITAAIVPALRNMTTDFSTEAFLPQHDQVVVDYDEFRYQFGQSSFGLVTIATPNDVFTMENLQRIKALQDDIEANVPHIDEIDSLVSVKHTIGSADGLEVRDLEEFWPRTEAEMPAFKQMVLGNPNYVGNMVSANGRVTSLIVKVSNYGGDSGADVDELVAGFDDSSAPVAKTDEQKRDRSNFLKPEEEAVFTSHLIATAKKHEAEGFKVYLNGIPVINYQMAVDLGESMMRDTSIGIGVLAILLFCLFHRLSGVLMPLMVVFLSLLTTMALMPLFGVPLMGSAQILPIFLLAVGIADSMHILAVFYQRYDEGAEKREAVIYAMTHTALAVLMTSVTTAAGLISFVLADLKPIQYLGIFGSSGTMLALFYTIVLIPALLMVLPVKRRPVTNESSTGIAHAILKGVDAMIFGLSSFAMRHAKAVFVATLLLAVWSFVGISKLYFSHDPVRWYPKEHPTRVASELIDTELSGTLTMEVIFDSGQENGLYDPKFMHLLEDTERMLLEPGVQNIKQTVSILGVVKENHKILNEGREEFYRIPDTREEIAQELLLFENAGSDDLEDFTDSNFRIARISAIMPFQNLIDMQDYLDLTMEKMNRLIAESGLPGVKVHITGLVMIFAKTLWAMLWGTISNYAQSFVMVGALMFVMMGSWRTGMLAFGPNMIPVLLTIGMMGWFDIPMDILTSMIGCIVIGIAVDDTIHFMHHYRNYIQMTNDAEKAVHLTLKMAGRAIVFTSVVLVGCFMVHTTDTFVTSRNFGILLSFALATALFCNLIIVPALMKLFWGQASK